MNKFNWISVLITMIVFQYNFAAAQELLQFRTDMPGMHSIFNDKTLPYILPNYGSTKGRSCPFLSGLIRKLESKEGATKFISEIHYSYNDGSKEVIYLNDLKIDSYLFFGHDKLSFFLAINTYDGQSRLKNLKIQTNLISGICNNNLNSNITPILTTLKDTFLFEIVPFYNVPFLDSFVNLFVLKGNNHQSDTVYFKSRDDLYLTKVADEAIKDYNIEFIPDTNEVKISKENVYELRIYYDDDDSIVNTTVQTSYPIEKYSFLGQVVDSKLNILDDRNFVITSRFWDISKKSLNSTVILSCSLLDSKLKVYRISDNKFESLTEYYFQKDFVPKTIYELINFKISGFTWCK